MIKPILLILVSVAVVTEAFVTPLPKISSSSLKMIKTSFPSTSSPAKENNALAKLQHEYKVLQEKLLQDVVLKHDTEEAEQIEEQMIQIATEATQLLEEQQMAAIQEAKTARSIASNARRITLSLLKKETDREREAALDELVRRSDFKELEATHQMEAAKVLLEELKENEQRLQQALVTLREQYENNDPPETEIDLEEELHLRHRSFLDQVQDAIRAHPDIMISLDPHIL